MKLDVKTYVGEVYEYLKSEIKTLEEKGIKPKFAIYQIGDNPASNKYISNKIKKAESIGIEVNHIKLTRRDDNKYDVEENGIPNVWDDEYLAHDMSVADLPKILQLPVSEDEEYLTNCIPSDIDLDGLSEYSKSKFYTSTLKADSTVDFFIPCTAKGVISYMEELTGGDLTGKSVLIISRSDIVGRPLAKLALDADMMVTVAHSKISKENILKMAENVDFIVSGIGIGHYFNQDEIPEGVAFIDVGIDYKDGKMVGDLEVYETDTANFDFTPVPGGVGQLTVASLLSNVVDWYME